MRLFDAHNHLQDDRFENPQDLMTVCRSEGLVAMVVNGACEQDWAAVAALATRFPEVIPSFGYHPWYLHERTADWVNELIRFVENDRGVVGEIGLDRWKPGLPYDGQEEAFVTQLKIAAERNLPVSIHCLEAWGRLYELLRGNPLPKRGFLLHSYGGSKEMIEPLAKLGAYFSFPGYYIHERKQRQRDAFQDVPIDRLLVETDAPDQLLPGDHVRHPLTSSNGKHLNHPGNIRAVYEVLAAIRGQSVEALAVRVEDNFRRLFPCVE